MSHLNQKQQRLFLSFLGVTVGGFSIGIFQKAALGTDPFTCFVTGIANLFASTYSTWYIILTGCLLALIACTERQYIGPATIVNLLLTGMAADMMRSFLDSLLPLPGFTQRVGLMLAAVLIMSFAAALYYAARLGVSAYDAIALMASECYDVAPFRICRILTDAVCVLIGWYLHANVGIGTVLTACCMGPIIEWFSLHWILPWMQRKGCLPHGLSVQSR